MAKNQIPSGIRPKIWLNNDMKLMVLVLMSAVLASCAPVTSSEQYKTKYSDAPTMQAAEDAGTKTFNEYSFDR